MLFLFAGYLHLLAIWQVEEFGYPRWDISVTFSNHLLSLVCKSKGDEFLHGFSGCSYLLQCLFASVSVVLAQLVVVTFLQFDIDNYVVFGICFYSWNSFRYHVDLLVYSEVIAPLYFEALLYHVTNLSFYFSHRFWCLLCSLVTFMNDECIEKICAKF